MRAEALATKHGTLPMWALGCTALLAALTGLLVARNAAVTAVVFLTLCACLLAWKKPVAVISGLAFYIPIERFITVRLPDAAFMISQASGEIVLLVLLGGILVRKAAARKAFVSTPLDMALLAFIGACLLSALVNGVAVRSVAYGVRIVLRYAVVFYAIANGGFTRRQLKLIIGAYLAAAGLQIAAGLIQALSGGGAKEWFMARREITFGGVTFAKGQKVGGATGQGLFTVIFGTLQNYNGYGMFLALAWLVAYAISREGDHFGGTGGFRMLLLLGLVCIVLSFSRSSLLTVLIGLAIISHVTGNRRMALAIVVVLAAGLGLIAFLGTKYSGQYLPVQSTNILHRWVRPFTPGNLAWEDAGNYRLFLLLVVSVRILSQSPVFGLGPGTFASALTMWPGSTLYEKLGMPSERAARYAADSNWTTVLAQTGLLGLMAFFFVIFGMGAYSVRVYRCTSDPVLKGLCLAQIGLTTALAVAGFFGPFFETRYTSFYFWVISGMVVALARAEGIPSGRGVLKRMLVARKGHHGLPAGRATAS